MFAWVRSLFGNKGGLRAVPSAGVYRKGGEVIYNMLDPFAKQFMGRCIGAIKKSGIKAKGTGQFSILLGDDQRRELQLDEFLVEFQQKQDASVFDKVVVAARDMIKQ